MSNIAIASLFAVVALSSSGCSSKKVVTKKIVINKVKPYKFNYTPIIGTQTPEDKVIVDMGVVLRVWIQSYKTPSGNLVASHDIYMWGKKPDFIVGNPIPTPSSSRGIISSRNKLPFELSTSEIDRSDFKSNQAVKKFVNSTYKIKNDKSNRPNSSKFDASIKKFLKLQNKGK